MRHDAIRKVYSNAKMIDDFAGVFDFDGNRIQIDDNLILAKIQELEAAEPLRLLRIERTRLLNETDWEVTRGIEEGIDITELKAYRSALRNLPQEIEAGNIEAPTLNENGELVFNSWPVRG